MGEITGERRRAGKRVRPAQRYSAEEALPRRDRNGLRPAVYLELGEDRP
jgi:hypothetical protein